MTSQPGTDGDTRGVGISFYGHHGGGGCRLVR